MARIRSRPQDFEVEEIPLFPASGEGHHTHLWIEKVGVTTDEMLRGVANEAGVPVREVGYAGRKDRHAVTRQWVSVPALEPAVALRLDLPGVRVLEAVRHAQKLRVGELAGNRFRLWVREVDPAAAAAAVDGWSTLAERGLPNRFGRQRFGRSGDNASRGARLLSARRLRIDRRQAWLMVSALQSAVFNEVLVRRPVGIDELLPGDVAIVHRTGELFRVEAPEEEAQRLLRLEVSATGPIFGTKMKRPGGEVAELERQVMEGFGLPDPREIRAPRGLRLYGARRPLRVPVHGEPPILHGDTLELRFELPPGAYATVVLEELFSGGVEEGPGG